MSTKRPPALHAELVGQIRRFIAGTIMFNHDLAERAGLHVTDMQCMNLLDLLGPVTPGRLARWTGLTTGGVTVMLDRLEWAGFVIREPNPLDRRSVVVRVNPKKFRTINALYAGINRQFEALLSGTPDAELRPVVKFFSRMNTIRREYPPA